jgi:hypothetical protein
MDDYSAVLPITWKSRLGIYYLCQPWFTQQLGIFSADMPRKDTISYFLSAIPGKFRLVDIQLNTSNNVVSDEFAVNYRANFILDLSPRYIQIESNYHRNCRRNVQKALCAGLYVKQGPGPSVFSRFIQRNLDRSLSENSGLFETLPAIVQTTIERGYGTIYGAYDRREDLSAAGWFVNIFGRNLFMVCASTATGKKDHAMSLLVDHMIREKAGSPGIFDFTGSNIPGVAYFNTGFGAVRQFYPVIKRNRLPWFVRLFK